MAGREPPTSRISRRHAESLERHRAADASRENRLEDHELGAGEPRFVEIHQRTVWPGSGGKLKLVLFEHESASANVRRGHRESAGAESLLEQRLDVAASSFPS